MFSRVRGMRSPHDPGFSGDDGAAGGTVMGVTEGHCPLWSYKNDRITLDRGADYPHGTFVFRVAEDLGDGNLSARLEFKVTYMIEADELEVRINGTTIPPGRIERRWCVGQSDGEGRPLGPYVFIRVPLALPPAKCGDNELGLRLTNRAGVAGRMPNAQEFEVEVEMVR